MIRMTRYVLSSECRRINSDVKNKLEGLDEYDEILFLFLSLDDAEDVYICRRCDKHSESLRT